MNTRNRPPASLRWLLLAQLCLVPCASLVRAQTAPAPAPAATSESDADKSDVTVLSPFEVVAEKTGYYSGTTMSGTRFNARLSDLASSITVMSKEQMADFGMLDVNDIFLYVAGTEGTGTYTDFTLDRNGSISDNVQINPTQANRVRGIAPANVSLGNIETMGRVPVDPSTIEAIEVSRGPNANVFGLGNPSGTVNQVAASANMTRNRVTAQLRGDSFDGWRTSLDFNRVLIKNKLAIRANGVFQHDGFKRKPSGVDTERYNGMIKFQPFKYTTITGSVNYYHAYGNRPNALPPRDNISYWIANGSPTWDPITQQIHNQDGTNRGAPITATTYNGPDYFSAAYLGNDRNQMFIDPTAGLTYWAAPRSTTNATSPVGATLGASRYLQTNPVQGAFSGTASRSLTQYLFNTSPTIADKAIYDYTSINLSAANRFDDRTTTSNLTVDQMIFNNVEQTLAAQVTFMREDSERWSRNVVGIANDNGTSGGLTVDINERLLDGTPNPYFLRPYLGVDKPRTVSQPAVWDTGRAQLAYRLDLTHNESKLLKYLGWFQLTTYGEYKNRINRQYSYRDAIASPNVSWIPTGTYRGFQSVPTGSPALINLTQGLYKYYVGDKGLNVDVAPGDFKLGTYNFVWGTSPVYNSAGVLTSPAVFHTDSLLLDRVGADKTGATFNTKLRIKTVGAVVQNHLFGDRLVTTFGARYDKTSTHFGDAGTPTNNFLTADGITFNRDATDKWATREYKNGGRTTNVQFVLRPFMDTPITANLERNGSGGQFFSSLLNGFSANFNKSNSFLITNPAQDLFRNTLPNTTGSDTSWGFGLNLLNGKLVVRATRFDNLQRNAQTTDINTLAGRVLRLDFIAPVGAGNPTPFLNLYENAVHWVQNSGTPAAEVDAKVKALTGFGSADRDYYAGAGATTLPIGATSDIRSVGTELEINYNPTKYWTITSSITDTKSINKNTSKALVDWIAERMPVWTTIVDTSINPVDAAAEGNPNRLWWLHKYSANAATTAPGAFASYSATAVTPQQNFQSFVGAPLGIIKEQEGKSNPQIRRYAFRTATSFQLAALTENKWLKRVTVGGALRWEDKAAIGYYGVQDSNGVYYKLDGTRPIYDKAHDYIDLFVSYKTKLWNDKVSATFNFNVKNLGQKIHLQPVNAFPDGTISTFRIVDPQQFIFTASFDL